MTVAITGSRESATLTEHPPTVGAAAESSGRGNRAKPRRAASTDPPRYTSDDEILGISSGGAPAGVPSAQLDSALNPGDGGAEASAAHDGVNEARDSADAPADPHVQAALDAHPEFRQAWQDAQSYREAFATPEEARAATALLGDLDRMDALFFSQRPEDHAELARAVANLDPVAFASIAKAMNDLAADGLHPATKAQESGSGENQQQIPRTPARGSANQSNTENARDFARNDNVHSSPTPGQAEFLHAANAAAVQGVLDAIETQVDRLLPEGVSKSARNRVVGEIYRELDSNLGANRQLGQQMRDAFRSGNLDAAHQSAIVALVTGRARQALPGIAKRVLNEWTSTVVAANQDRMARQRAAAHRVDIAGSGRGADGGRRSLGPRDIDYTHMSDSDILNL